LVFVANIYHFDENGIQKDGSPWSNVLCIPIIEDSSKDDQKKEWLKSWNKALVASFKDERWQKQRYFFM